MPRRNISAWKVCMSWQSGQRKWCRAARRAWPWRRGNISRGALRIAPGLGMTPGLRGWVVLGTMLLRSCGNAAYLDAVAVEMRAGAGGADEGPVAGASLHRLQADGTLGVLLSQRLHLLRRPVLPAEGPAGWMEVAAQPPAPSLLQPCGCPHSPVLPKKLGDTAAFSSARVVEGAGASPAMAADRGAPPPADTAHLGTAVRCWASVPCTRR